MRLAVAPMLVALMIAGCLQSGDPGPAAQDAPITASKTAFALHVLDGEEGWEPTIGMDPDGRIFVAGWGAAGPAGLTQTKVLRSDDDGVSWMDVTPSMQGLATQPSSITAKDPYLHVDPVTGSIFATTLSTGCLYVSRSDDGGEAWPVNNPVACSGQPADHQTVFTGITDLPTQGYSRAVHLCYNQLPLLTPVCALSLDGGATFGPAVALAATSGGEANAVACGLHGHGATGPHGEVYLAQGKCGPPVLFTSPDALAWTARPIPYGDGSDDDPQVAVDADGGLGVVVHDGRDRVAFLHSGDGGRTWSEPFELQGNQSTGVRLGSLTAGMAGRFAAMHVERDEQDRWHLMVHQIQSVGKEVLVETVRATPADDPIMWHPSIGGAGTGGVSGLGDFLDIDHDPTSGRIVVAYVDACDGCGPADPDSAAPRGDLAVAVQQDGPGLFTLLA